MKVYVFLVFMTEKNVRPLTDFVNGAFLHPDRLDKDGWRILTSKSSD